MAYDPGALDATLAAAVGDMPNLVQDLRTAFIAAATGHVETMRRAQSVEGWTSAAARLRSLAASFGARRLMDSAEDACAAGRIDPHLLGRIDRSLRALDE